MQREWNGKEEIMDDPGLTLSLNLDEVIAILQLLALRGEQLQDLPETEENVQEAAALCSVVQKILPGIVINAFAETQRLRAELN